MKRFWNRILDWWVFGVTNTKQRVVVLDGFEYRFNKYDLRIRSLSKNFELRIRCTEYMYGYLAAALQQGKEDQLKFYSAIMFVVGTEIGHSSVLSRKVSAAVDSYVKHTMEQAKAPKEDKAEEQAILAAEKDDLEAGKRTRRERRERKKQLAKVIKEEINNGKKE